MHLRHSLIALASLSLTACTSIDCSLDSVVVWTLTFYDSHTQSPLKLPCTLSVEGQGTGTLFNKANDVSSITLPMSHTADADTLLLHWSRDNNTPPMATDIIRIAHTNSAHFDAIDCPAAVFHNITKASLHKLSEEPSPVGLDSLTIIRSQVDYTDAENIRLYLHTNPLPDTDIDDTEDINGDNPADDTPLGN